MAIWLEKLGLFARSPDARPLSEIAADIDAELAFHVEESARALTEEGLDADSARAEALRRFGDFGRIRRECARTQMGERVMLQRIQLVLTAVLILAVVVLVWSNHEARAAMQAERAQNLALLSRIEARIGGDDAARNEDVPTMTVAPAGSVIDRKPMHPALIDRKPTSDPGEPMRDEPLYLGADGSQMFFDEANNSWWDAFGERGISWRHGLRTAERLAALPGSQGAEILAQLWSRLPVEQREQAMKPFVFDGGHPNALEILALGIDLRQETSVRERAALYLQTYAWQNLLYGDGTAEAWLAEWRDRPVAEVLRANATRWARELGLLVQQYEMLPADEAEPLLAVVDQIRLETFKRADVDLPAILEANGLRALSNRSLGNLDAEATAQARKVSSWLPPK